MRPSYYVLLYFVLHKVSNLSMLLSTSVEVDGLSESDCFHRNLGSTIHLLCDQLLNLLKPQFSHLCSEDNEVSATQHCCWGGRIETLGPALIIICLGLWAAPGRTLPTPFQCRTAASAA